MITLDTSAVIADLERKDRDHPPTARALRGERPPLLVPAAVLGEVGYFIESRPGRMTLEAFLDDLRDGTFTLDRGEDDMGRIRELVGRYADLPLRIVHAAVIACAERNGFRTLTLDQRDFGVVAREVPLTLLPGSPA
jgi:predicted nucleic acid-binding protein